MTMTVNTLFSCIAMGIVGPLERCKVGHKYIWVVCDYATKYLEASPLKKDQKIVNWLIHEIFRLPKFIQQDPQHGTPH